MDRMATSVMWPHKQQRLSWSESICLASTDVGGYCYRRSASVSSVQPGRPEIRRRQGVRLGLSLTPTAFAESVLCYVGAAGPSARLPHLVSRSTSAGKNVSAVT